MRDASFVIGNDSGGIHLAAAYGIPAFAVMHCADFGRYIPNPYYKNLWYFYHKRSCFLCRGNCVEQKFDPEKEWPCLRDVQPEDVYPAIRDFLSGCSGKDCVSEERGCGIPQA